MKKSEYTKEILEEQIKFFNEHVKGETIRGKVAVATNFYWDTDIDIMEDRYEFILYADLYNYDNNAYVRLYYIADTIEEGFEYFKTLPDNEELHKERMNSKCVQFGDVVHVK